MWSCWYSHCRNRFVWENAKKWWYQVLHYEYMVCSALNGCISLPGHSRCPIVIIFDYPHRFFCDPVCTPSVKIKFIWYIFDFCCNFMVHRQFYVLVVKNVVNNDNWCILWCCTSVTTFLSPIAIFYLVPAMTFFVIVLRNWFWLLWTENFIKSYPNGHQCMEIQCIYVVHYIFMFPPSSLPSCPTIPYPLSMYTIVKTGTWCTKVE